MYDDRIKVLPGYDDVFPRGGYKTIDEIIAALKTLDKQGVANTLSATMLLIINPETINRGVDAHISILSGLMTSEDLDFLRAYIDKRQENNVLFLQDQVLSSLMKLNYNENDTKGVSLDTAEGRQELAKVILSMNAIWSKDMYSNGKIEEDKALKEKLRILHAVQFLTYGNDPLKNMLARGNYFINQYHEYGFDKVFYGATGIELKNYMDMVFMMTSNWNVIDFYEISKNIFKTTDFFKNTNIPKDQVDSFLEMISFQADDFKKLNEEYTRRVRLEKDSIYNQILFMLKPIQRNKDLLICVNPYFLARALMEGPYNIVREALKGKGKKVESSLPQMMGEVFENYINEEFRRTFRKRYISNVMSPDGKWKSIDGILILKGIVLLIETKSPHMSFETRVKGSKELLREFIHKFGRYKPYGKDGKTRTNKKGFGQIKQFIMNYKKGLYKGQYDFNGKKLVPVVVSAEEFPSGPLNREFLIKVLQEEDCLVEDVNISQPILLSAEEVELIHSLAEAKNIAIASRVIQEYSNEVDKSVTLPYPYRITTFKNFIYLKSINFSSNKLMEIRFNSIIHRVQSILKNVT